MYAVTTAAVRSRQLAGAQRQAVIAVGKGREALAAHAVFFNQARRSMATAAGFNREILRRGRRRSHL